MKLWLPFGVSESGKQTVRTITQGSRVKQVEATNHYLLEESVFSFTKRDRLGVELRIRCMKIFFVFLMNFILQSIQNKTVIKVFAMVDKFQTTRVF